MVNFSKFHWMEFQGATVHDVWFFHIAVKHKFRIQWRVLKDEDDNERKYLSPIVEIIKDLSSI